MTRAILKWSVPVDGNDHPVGAGRVVHVGCQNDDHRVVQVWTDEVDVGTYRIRSARVYGTGEPLPPDGEHLGSVVVGPLVWHVLGSSRPPSGLSSVE